MVLVSSSLTVSAQSPDADALRESFRNPPASYGIVPFFWWTGEPLSRERIAWELDQLKTNGFSGVNVNYTHTNLGHTYRNDPPLFSDEWWTFWEGIVEECAQRDMAIGFDDYLVTHGNPDLSTVGSQIRADEPKVAGLLLRQQNETVRAGDAYDLAKLRADDIVAAAAYRLDGDRLVPGSAVALEALSKTDERWKVPEGTWTVSILKTEPQPFGALNPLYAQKVIEHYFARFEKHSKGLLGQAVNYFFQDELTFGGSMPYWSPDFLQQFQAQKGYDLLPELTALFADLGPRTPKIRLDYYDVVTRLMEEAYFRPIFDWCEARGVLYGHDQCARADVLGGVSLYGDYFRTLRWYQAPGTDRVPELLRGKVCSSIAQLYDRPRVWLEAYHSTGWGLTPAQIAHWDFESLMYGYNLFSYHSLYYTTRAGWWAWAPGDIHFRQPYWSWMKEHYRQVQRLCYLLSQGKHRCDLAVLFPSSTVQADTIGTSPGDRANEASRLLGVTDPLFKEHGIDFEFIDDESLARAVVQNGRLEVSGGSYRVVMLPAVRAIRHSSLDKLQEFVQHGGAVIALNALPESSDRAGADDPALDAAVKEIFGSTAWEAALQSSSVRSHRHASGGHGVQFMGDTGSLAAPLAEFITTTIERDFICRDGQLYVMHRLIGDRDIYALYNPTSEAVEPELYFRITGRIPERWDTWTGETKSLTAYRVTNEGIEIRVPFAPHELTVIAFSPGTPQSGEFTQTIQEKVLDTIPLEGLWDFTVEPVMDNQWGDFRSPPTPERVGPEARQFRYQEEWNSKESARNTMPDLDDSTWETATASWGPRLWLLGPVPKDVDTAALENQLREFATIDPTVPIQLNGFMLHWQPYSYSLRWGIENDPTIVRQTGIAIHGPIGWVPDEFIHLQTKEEGDSWYLWTSVDSAQAQTSRVAVGSRAGYKLWLNGNRLIERREIKSEIHEGPWGIVDYPSAGQQSAPVELPAGHHSLLLKLTGAGAGSLVRAYMAFGEELQDQPEPALTDVPSGNAYFVASGLVTSKWFTRPQKLNFDIYPNNKPTELWYRFPSPPGLKALTMTVHGEPTAWIDGKEVDLQRLDAYGSPACQYENATAYRLELGSAIPKSATMAVRIVPQPGYYGGAALPEPIRFECATGQASLGDWSALGLATYSGSVRYETNFTVTKNQLSERLILDLGDVAAAAEVWVNGERVDRCLQSPWRLDITPYVREKENRLTAVVANTLANHYSVGMPEDHRYIYAGQTRAGLLGPARIEIVQHE